MAIFLAQGCGGSACEKGFIEGADGECLKDRDGDGFDSNADCDDKTADRSPAAEDLVGDAVDQNCDGLDGVDLDGDGVASVASGGEDCDDGDPDVLGVDADADGVPWCLDCNDADPMVRPGAVDACDGVDQNCDGLIDVDDEGVGTCVLDGRVSGSMDVLFIVDNSCSMFEEQNALAASVSNILQPFIDQGTDFHIGVVSTDMVNNSESGKLIGPVGLKWVDQFTPDPLPTLAGMFVLGTLGDFNEKGRDAAYAAVELLAIPGGYNDGFIREEADLAMVVLSDEDDFSTRVGLQEFIDWAANFKDGPIVSFHSIVSPANLCPTASSAGIDYIAVTDAIGGARESICAQDFSPILDEIARDYAPPPSDGSFELPYAVDPASLAATVTPPGDAVINYAAADMTWDPVQFTVSFPEVPVVSSQVQIWYAPAAVETP